MKDKNPFPRDPTLSSLNVAIVALDLSGTISNIPLVKVTFGSASITLTMIRDLMVKEVDYVELGLACAEVCATLDRGLDGKVLKDLNSTLCQAIGQLAMTVVEVQRKILSRNKQGTPSKREAGSSQTDTENDKEMIIAWRLDLHRTLHIFKTELGMRTHVSVSYKQIQTRVPEEFLPPPPKTFFGREEFIEKIVGYAQNLTPLALIGGDGIGKTSIALAVLHDHRIKQRFGNNRRFIRCDQFPASLPHFLHRISQAIDAHIKFPNSVGWLRSYPPTAEFFVILDSAESILDPGGLNFKETYAAAEELCQFTNISLCIVSRTSSVPLACKRLDIPKLSKKASHNTFHQIYGRNKKPGGINNVLQQLNFHPLSIVLLATAAYHNEWNTDQLNREWERQRVEAAQTEHDETLATTIELSLSSSVLREFGPNAREVLGVIAFFPQGIHEGDIGLLFPTTSGIFDKFCALSLTYQSDGFVTMLGPLRSYFGPDDPTSSPLLHTIKERYFSRLSARVNPGEPNFEEPLWITTEGANIVHLLSVFASVDMDSLIFWDACGGFVRNPYWHKPWLVALGRKVEGLPDHHRFKAQYLFQLSELFQTIREFSERKWLLIHALRLWREEGNDFEVARTLVRLADANLWPGEREKGIPQAKEALEVFERLNRPVEQAQALQALAQHLNWHSQYDAAEEATSRSFNLISDKGQELLVCRHYEILGAIYCSKVGKSEKAKYYYGKALAIASSFGWQDRQFWILDAMGINLCDGITGLDEAQAYVERAEAYAVNDVHLLVRAMWHLGLVLYKQRRFEEAKLKYLRGADLCEKLGDSRQRYDFEDMLQGIERAKYNLVHDHLFNSNSASLYTSIISSPNFIWCLFFVLIFSGHFLSS